MENIIKNTAELLTSLNELKCKLENKEYWLNKAKKETGLVLSDDAWIHVEVTLWKIRVSVYSNRNNPQRKYWINGEWFDSSFDINYPDLKALL